MKFLLSHPTGNRNVRAIISALQDSGSLAEFHTTLAVDPESLWLKFLPHGLQKECMRRTYEVPESIIRTHPLRELSRMALPRFGLGNWVAKENGWASIDSVYRDLDKAMARRLSRMKDRKKINAVYAYEDGALATFQQAKKWGIPCVYDLPIAYWETARKLIKEESERLPQWAVTLAGGLNDSQEKLERKTRELQLADMVITPGQFVEDSLPTWSIGKKIISVPFGSPSPDGLRANDEGLHLAGRPLRVLFAGSMGQRKGLADLFAAVKLVNNKNLELVVMGSLQAPMGFYREQLKDFMYEPGRPHDQVLALMRSCDVLCLPSIVEGRALVMQEAMSQGLPLIITPNTGGSDLILPGKTGFLVPIRSPQAIAEKLNWFLDNRSCLPDMKLQAIKHASGYTWNQYGKTILSSLFPLIEETTARYR
jgi:glycosyltransferase involved in cell wall biosynthesis